MKKVHAFLAVVPLITVASLYFSGYGWLAEADQMAC